MNNDLSLTVIRRQMYQRKIVNQNIHNLAMSTFKPGREIKFRSNQRDYFGKVVEVIGSAGSTQVRVVNLSTGKQRDLRLEDVTGLVQEN